MSNQIWLLFKVSMLNRFGINEARYGKDPVKKRKLMMLGIVFGILGAVIVSYSAAISYGVIVIGAGDVLPAYVLVLISVIIFVLSVLKAGSLIFEIKSYEMLVSLPFQPAAIVISRFLTMYVGNLVFSFLVVIPTSIVYGVFEHGNLPFYLMMVAGIFIIPLIPMVVATAIGALVIGISARMKHKNLVAIIVSMGLLIGFLVISTVTSTSMQSMTEVELENLVSLLKTQLFQMYPLAKVFNVGVVETSWMEYFKFVALSVVLFSVFVFIVQSKFISISSALNARAKKEDYKMTKLKQGTALMAFYKKELSGYFSSLTYVINTVTGYVLVILLAISILISGVDTIEQSIGINGVIRRFLPFVMSSLCVIMSTTTSAISMEGTHWWIPLSLPVRAKTVFDSKILVNLTIAIPSVIISAVIAAIATKATILELVVLLLLPLAYCIYASVLGILVNAHFPMFHWENETAVIKQSAAVMICMIVGIISVVIPAAISVLLSSISKEITGLLAVLLLGVITAFLYQKVNKMELNQIQ